VAADTAESVEVRAALRSDLSPAVDLVNKKNGGNIAGTWAIAALFMLALAFRRRRA